MLCVLPKIMSIYLQVIGRDFRDSGRFIMKMLSRIMDKYFMEVFIQCVLQMIVSACLLEIHMGI